MLTSYSHILSENTKPDYSCSVCLNDQHTTTSWARWQIFCLPNCEHTMHRACLDGWFAHYKELAKRDASLTYQETCPLCKIEVDQEQAHIILGDYQLLANPAEVNPDRPLHSSENRDPNSRCDVQSLQDIFDKAVTFENSPLYLDHSNFPALHQMKNRYDMTLSAEQLRKILYDALVTTSPYDDKVKWKDSILTAAANQIRMAMALRTDDTASRDVINEFFIKILGLGLGYNQKSTVKCKDDVIGYLLEHVITDRELAQKGFDYYIQKRDYREAVKLHKKYHFHIEYETLKQALMGPIYDDTIRRLSQIASSEDIQRAALDALKALNETMLSSYYDATVVSHDATGARNTITALLSTGIRDQAEINKTLRLAVLADDTSWQKELINEHGAILDSQFFKDQLESTKDSNLAKTIGKLFELRVDDEVSREALMAAMMKVTTLKVVDYLHFRVGDLVIKCLENGVQSQQLINNALTQAIDSGCARWALDLNRDHKAVLDPQALGDYLWGRLESCPSNMARDLERRFTSDFKHALTLADKENKQTSSVINSLVNKVISDADLSQRPVVQECIKALLEFNEPGSPDSKRKKS